MREGFLVLSDIHADPTSAVGLGYLMVNYARPPFSVLEHLLLHHNRGRERSYFSMARSPLENCLGVDLGTIAIAAQCLASAYLVITEWISNVNE